MVNVITRGRNAWHILLTVTSMVENTEERVRKPELYTKIRTRDLLHVK
jgi:hypothetical protein